MQKNNSLSVTVNKYVIANFQFPFMLLIALDEGGVVAVVVSFGCCKV